MRKNIFLLGALLAVSAATMAQTKQGGISAQMLSQIEKMQKTSAADKALFNAIAANSIDDLVKNRANAGPVDTHFSVETPAQRIHNQKSSGRCWMFSGMNVLRANFAKAHADSLAVEFSQDYLFFYDQLEKANLMLQGVIDHARKSIEDPQVQFFFKSPLNDGGTFCGVADLAAKYGLELRRMAAAGKNAKQIAARKTEMLATVYHMLCLTLGEPVKEFSYAFRNKDGKQMGDAKTYTPKSFYDATVGKELNGTFIMVMNDPRRPYHKTYEVEYDRHTYDGHNWKYLNLPMDEIASLAIASLKDGRKMYSSYDVGKQFDRKRGYLDLDNYDYASLFGTTFPMNKAERISTFDSGSTHAMTLTAVDLDANGKPLKWKVENSWGADNGQKGCLIMTNRWFNEYMFRLVVDKQYVPAQLLKEFDQKPVMLTADDPLFQLED